MITENSSYLFQNAKAFSRKLSGYLCLDISKSVLFKAFIVFK